MSKRFFILMFVVIVALLGGLAWFHYVFLPQMIKQAIANAPQPPVTVSAESARLEKWTPKLSAIGSLRAVTGIDVTAEVGGIIRTINFASGDDVEAGSLLVQLDDRVEQADLQSNLATLKNAENDLVRQRDLFRRGTVPQSQLDTATARRDEAAASVDKTRAVIAQKRVVAAFSGRLGIRKVDVGQYISPGMALVPLQALDQIYADFPLPEQELSRLKLDQDVEIRVDAYPGGVFKGKVDAIDSRVNQETRSVMVRGRLDNAGKELLPGMFANVEVLAGAPADVVTVPRTAVSYSLYGDSVYIARKPAAAPAGQARANEELYEIERRFVRPGDARGNRVVINEGVKPGELVVIVGQLKLDQGAKVRIDNSTLPKPQVPRPSE
jgi:membrane fusion protein (multidrug efflux system)